MDRSCIRAEAIARQLPPFFACAGARPSVARPSQGLRRLGATAQTPSKRSGNVVLSALATATSVAIVALVRPCSSS